MLIFVEGKANKTRRVWKIFFANRTIGKCTISNDGDSDDEHYSIYLKLNEASRGLGLEKSVKKYTSEVRLKKFPKPKHYLNGRKPK